jgi:hypothetical protein
MLRRIMFSSGHSRMGITVLLSQLSATTELFVKIERDERRRGSNELL